MYGDVNHVEGRIILVTTNEEALKVNNEILNLSNEDFVEYQSIDEAKTNGNNNSKYFPNEFLHSLTPNGFPPHSLKLKKGTLIMIIRNLDFGSGLINCNRLKVIDFKKDIIKAKFISGQFKNKEILIPRIQFVSNDIDLPFEFCRRQFLVRVCYCMTINKSQGLSFEHVGIDLKCEVFTHRQLYTAISRCKKFNNLKIHTDGFTNMIKNIVFNDVLLLI
uniref:ATP-dependent DNA helicase n=1 Tax=Rhabditophanes sp. KR3021 TaxID=114890 RepID=A0AC35TSH8_9BILA